MEGEELIFMSNRDPESDKQEEPSDEEIAAWLKTPEGRAAMEETMRSVVAGELGEVPEELLVQAREGLKKRAVFLDLEEMQRRMLDLAARLQEEPEGSDWAHVNRLEREIKEVMDLTLGVPDPHRAQLMPFLSKFQARLEELKKRL
jgi:hypothetical protein